MRSGYESNIARNLRAKKIPFIYEAHSYEYFLFNPRTTCSECGTTGRAYTSHWYTPDFFLSNGVVIEAKGKFTAKERKKLVAVQEDHPDLDLRLMFMRNNRIRKGSDTRYTDWATKNGFISSVGTNVPVEWTL